MSAAGPELNPEDIVPGTKYRVVRPIGAGGMGIVYLVVKPPDIQGVLKLMSSELTGMEDQRIRFFDEVRILARLEHPNIVRVFDYDALPDGTPFYVMEVLNGSTVRDVLETMGRVPPRVAYEVTRQLLEALQCAHTYEVPVIHRDIKPENIFLHAPRHGEPVVKLIDFGVSSVADRGHDGTFVGTWSYAAPEQIRGERPTPATDLYAAGLVLYEMLAGRGPFDHHSDWTQIAQAQTKEIPAPVSKFAPWVPASIVELVASALAKDPRARPRDAYAFAERLFELEWASDGKDPHDRTAEGRSRALSKVLSTVSGRKIETPMDPVPPESVRAGPTWRGLPEVPVPDTAELLEGLSAEPRKPPSRRESDPELALSPRPGQVVVRAGRNPSDLHEQHGPTTPRAAPVRESGTALTLDETPAPAPGVHSARDTFSSPASDTASKKPTSRRGALAIAALLLFAGIAASVWLTRGPEPPAESSAVSAPPPPPPTVVVPAAEPPSAPPAAPPPSAPPAASSSAPRVSAPPKRPAAATAAPAPPPSTDKRGDYMRGGPSS